MLLQIATALICILTDVQINSEVTASDRMFLVGFWN